MKIQLIFGKSRGVPIKKLSSKWLEGEEET